MAFYDLGNLGFADVGKVLIVRLRIPWEEFEQRFATQLKTLQPKTYELLRNSIHESQDPSILMEEAELDVFFRSLKLLTARVPTPASHLNPWRKHPLMEEAPAPGIHNVKSFTLIEGTPASIPVPRKPRFVRISFLYNALVEELYEFSTQKWGELNNKQRTEKIAFLKSNIDRTQKILLEVHGLDQSEVEDFWRQVLEAYTKLQGEIEKPWWHPILGVLSPTLPAGVVSIYALCVAEKLLNAKKPFLKEYWAFQEAADTNFPPEQLEAIFNDIAFKQQLFVVSVRSLSLDVKSPPLPEKWSIVVVNHHWIAHTINERKDFKYKVIGQEIPFTALETSFRLVGPLHSYQSLLTTLSQRRLLSKPLDYTETSLIIIGKPYVTMGSTLRIIIGIVAGALSIYISLSRIFPPSP